MPTSLPTLALRIADITRQATALIVALVTADIQRSWAMVEWDENLHPRGSNGKFIGGSGLQAEREAYHAEHAIARFNKAADAMHLQGALREHAAKAFHLLLHNGQDIQSIAALHAHHEAMTRQAAEQARWDTRDREESHRLVYLRTKYASALKFDTTLSAYSRGRLQREIDIIDRYLARMWIPAPVRLRLPADQKASIRAQVQQGIAADRSAPVTAMTE